MAVQSAPEKTRLEALTFYDERYRMSSGTGASLPHERPRSKDLRTERIRRPGAEPWKSCCTMRPNTCALAPYLTLTEANASFEVRPLNFRKSEQSSPAYLRLNPKHKVPLLVVDGEPLTESPAIQIWIARNFPQCEAAAVRSDGRS